MKLVRENINEKFVEDSDPIYDMGIGIKYKLDKWVSRNREWIDKDDINVRLRMAAYYGKLEFVKYLLDMGADINTEGGMPLTNAIMNNHLDVAKYLIKRAADINKILRGHSESNIQKLKNILK
jgi:hypothetical protein